MSRNHEGRGRLSAENTGIFLGCLGMFIFAMTLPMTRLAVGTASEPSLDPVFVTAFRAAGAGLLGACYLLAVRAPRIARADWGLLGVNALGTIVGFPLFLALALRDVEATHAAVITGVLPLGTALAAAIHFRQRPSPAFWGWAVLGAALVVGFALLQGGGRLRPGDVFLLLAVASASIGYVAGARLSAALSATVVISWALVACLPAMAAASWWHWPAGPVAWEAWVGMAYLIVFSMWLGFIAWYRGLVLGGTIRVSQVQLVQPFIALLLCWPILGDAPEPLTYAFMGMIMAVVFLGKKAPVGAPRPRRA